MLQLLIAIARSVMVIGVVIAILLGGLGGMGAAQEAGGAGILGFILGAGAALILSSVFFGVAAAIFDIQEQTRAAVNLLRQQIPHPGALAPSESSTSNIPTSDLPPQPAPEEPGSPAQIGPRFPESREGWRLLEKEAEAQGWKVTSGLTGVTFTHEGTGRRVRCNSVHEAEQQLGLRISNWRDQAGLHPSPGP
ncbi:MAG TPA: hypothetical protein VNZ61_02445 [Roseomonas sp.]|nr:hypothetical protein [Roseomonas sp.]